MSKEAVNQIYDEAYSVYVKETMFSSDPTWLEPVPCMNIKTGEIQMGARQFFKERFINKCKTDSEFSEKWGNLVNTATSNIETTKTDGTKPSLLSYDELEDIKRRYTPAQIKEMWEHAQPKIRFAIYEKIPRHGKEPNGLILGPFDTEDLAKEAGEKWGYSGDNYFIDLYRD